jgi:hypothetical protein
MSLDAAVAYALDIDIEELADLASSHAD